MIMIMEPLKQFRFCLCLIQWNQRMRFRQILVAIFTDIEIALIISEAIVTENGDCQSAEVANSAHTHSVSLRIRMTDRTLRLGAGKESALDTEDAFLLRGGALLADRGTDCLTIAEMTYFVDCGLEKIIIAVDFLENFFIKEEKFMIFKAHEFLVSLDLLLEIVGNKLTLLAVRSKLVSADKLRLALQGIEGTVELDGQVGDWFEQAGVGTPVGAEVTLDLEAGGAVQAEDLLAGSFASDQLSVNLIANHALEIGEIAGVSNVVLGQQKLVHLYFYLYLNYQLYLNTLNKTTKKYYFLQQMPKPRITVLSKEQKIKEQYAIFKIGMEKLKDKNAVGYRRSRGNID